MPIKGCHPYIQYLTKEPEEGVFLAALSSNRAFRSLAEKTLKAINSLATQSPPPASPASPASQQPSTDIVPNTVEGVVKMAVAISKKFKEKHYEGVTAKQPRWLHPATIMYWFSNVPASLNSMPSKYDESSAMLSAFIKSYCIPSSSMKYLYKLQNLFKQTGIFTFKQQVWTPDKPSQKVARGYQLTELTFAIPFGAKLFSVGKDQPKVVGPEKIQTITLNLLDQKVIDVFGEVWIMINDDGSVMIASQHKPNISFIELLKLVKPNNVNVFDADVIEPKYSIGINSLARLQGRKLPDDMTSKLSKASSVRKDTQVVIP